MPTQVGDDGGIDGLYRAGTPRGQFYLDVLGKLVTDRQVRVSVGIVLLLAAIAAVLDTID
jgi:hypothetical protein